MGGLYKKFKRVSCWCCPLQPISEFRILWKDFPDLWEELKDMENRTWRTIRSHYSVHDLEDRFKLEEEYLKQGKSITNKEFYDVLKDLLLRNRKVVK